MIFFFRFANQDFRAAYAAILKCEYREKFNKNEARKTLNELKLTQRIASNNTNNVAPINAPNIEEIATLI